MKKNIGLFAIITIAITALNCDRNMRDTLVIGHRGAMGHETENSLASVKKALDLGVDMIEIDVFRIESGEIMVFHDEHVERLTDGEGRIEEYNVLDAKNLKLKGNHKIPLLQEVLQLVDKKAMLNIELKGADTADRVNFIVKTYIKDQGWTADQFLISSFNWDELHDLREHNDKIAIAVLTEGDPLKAISVARELNAVAINPNFALLSKEKVEAIQEAGFEVYTWTVNEPEDIERMKKWGVDGIFSDFPERL